MSLILKTFVIVGVGAVLWTGVQHVREAPTARPAAGSLPLSAAQMAPIPGLDSDPHPISENLHPLGSPQVQPLDLGNANARASASELHRLDQQGVSGSWAFPRNQRP